MLDWIGQFPVVRNESEFTFEVRGVPPGDWRLLLRGVRGDESYVAWATAVAGDDFVAKLLKE